MKVIYWTIALSWIGLWLTPDQQGQRLYRREQYTQAAEAFHDPWWRGTAWYRAGEFEKAAHEFGRMETAEAQFDQGNAWLMLGKYDQAIASYERALKQQPDWKQARENRDLAVARQKLIQQTGGDLGEQRLGADKVVFDQNKPPGGQDTVVAGQQAVSDAAIQSMWLRRVQTSPADFLRSKFAYQQARASKGEGP